MNYLSVAETAKKWNISERSVRNYCAQERIPGAVLIGKTWHIPENAEKPARSNGKKTPVKTLLSILQEEKRTKYVFLAQLGHKLGRGKSLFQVDAVFHDHTVALIAEAFKVVAGALAHHPHLVAGRDVVHQKLFGGFAKKIHFHRLVYLDVEFCVVCKYDGGTYDDQSGAGGKAEA